ncbi:hypothetical protein LOK49_LG03G02867 [Camellia lanceoleosa]|uniref:Uncharacterized protein n=1 Tax=Camellia lanceoleosa TaxID=1840588 RepID=A0ACC0IFR0_9ERIC|nr:hypothetical protein LOK49_LG03G02867 [Camellia lanceoleosa]
MRKKKKKQCSPLDHKLRSLQKIKCWKTISSSHPLKPIFLTFSSTFFYSYSDGASQNLHLQTIHISGIANESEYGVVSWGTRRSVLEGPSLILAAERTHRKDPFDNFKYYTGGWNISDQHYFYISYLLWVLCINKDSIKQNIYMGIIDKNLLVSRAPKIQRLNVMIQESTLSKFKSEVQSSLCYKSNNWGVGLPPKEKNEKNWPLIKPRLADLSFKPQSSHILAAVENFLNVQCGDVEFEKKIDEKIGQFIDRVEKNPSKKIDEKIGQF